MLVVLVKQRGVGVLKIAPVAIPLAIEVETGDSRALNGEAADQVGRRQSVVEANSLQIGDVGDVALRPFHYNKRRLRRVDYFGGQRCRRRPAHPRLAVRPHLDLEVIGQHIVEIYADDRRRVGADVGRIVEIVIDHDALLAIRGQKTRAPETAEDDRPLRAGTHYLAQCRDGLAPGVEIAAGDPHIVRK